MFHEAQEQGFLSSSSHRIGGIEPCQGVFGVLVAARRGYQYDDANVPNLLGGVSS